MSSEQVPVTSVNLRIPQQTLNELTGTEHQPDKFKQWLDNLPKGNTGETAKKIHVILDEIGRLKTTTNNRFELLELIRPAVLNLFPSLNKHYLKQPLILPPKGAKVAAITQSILLRLITGYKVVLAESFNEIKQSHARRNIKISLHRSITLSTLRLMHNYQLYTITPKAVWHDIYQFYTITEHYKVAEEEVGELKSSTEKTSLKHEFLRAIMMAASSPNKLLQSQITEVFNATAYWAKLVEIDPESNPPCLYYLDLLSDTPPSYHNWLGSDRDSQLRNIHFGVLVKELEKLKNHQSSDDINLPKGITPYLLTHLCTSWSNSTQRTFTRTPQEGNVEVTVGFSASHYYISGEMEFSTFVRGGKPELLAQNDRNMFLNPSHNPLAPVPSDQEKSSGDIWSLKYTAPITPISNSSDSDSTTKTEKALQDFADTKMHPFQSSSCGVVDTSPCGYCIEWTGEITGQLRNGELITVKEELQNYWQIGVVRWINQISAHSARIGLELMAPHGQTGGAAVIHKKGPIGDYIRVIQLPEVASIGQLSTLLTPSMCFHEGDKIMLTYLEKKVKAKLTKRISSTSGYCQFLFEILEQEKAPTDKQNHATQAANAENDSFHDVWKLL
ncbi:MAG: hypothetical protein KUG83_08795 [Gammaproteobacteria bacterium]|nr:hypothetical protein [Gammaproteobacteria bacterium]